MFQKQTGKDKNQWWIHPNISNSRLQYLHKNFSFSCSLLQESCPPMTAERTDWRWLALSSRYLLHLTWFPQNHSHVPATAWSLKELEGDWILFLAFTFFGRSCPWGPHSRTCLKIVWGALALCSSAIWVYLRHATFRDFFSFMVCFPLN